MTKYIIIFLISISFLSCSFFEKQKAEGHYKKALNFEVSKKLDSALIEIDKAILLSNTNIDFSIRKAKILIKLEFYEKSNEILFNLFKNDSSEDIINIEFSGTGVDSIDLLIADNYFSIAYKSGLQTNEISPYYYDCIRYCDFVIKNDYKNYDAYSIKTRALHNAEKYIEKIDVSNEMIRIFPDSIIAIRDRGISKIILEDLGGGIDDLNAYIKIGKSKKEIALAYRFLGYAYKDKGNYTKAIEFYTKSIKDNDKDTYTYIDRAKSFLELGDYESACKDFRKASDMGYNSFEDIKRYCN